MFQPRDVIATLILFLFLCIIFLGLRGCFQMSLSQADIQRAIRAERVRHARRIEQQCAVVKVRQGACLEQQSIAKLTWVP